MDDNEQRFRATKDHQSISFGANDGTTHRLEPDQDGVIVVDNGEDAAYLEMLGLRHAKPEAPAPAADKAEKKEG